MQNMLQEIAPYSLLLLPLPRDFSRKRLIKANQFHRYLHHLYGLWQLFYVHDVSFFFSWQVCKHAIHGDANNRWFDKAVSVLVFKSGRLATQCDVSVLTKTAFCSCKKVSILPHTRDWKFLGGGGGGPIRPNVSGLIWISKGVGGVLVLKDLDNHLKPAFSLVISRLSLSQTNLCSVAM